MQGGTDGGLAERGMQPGRNVIELIMMRLPSLRKSDRRVAEHILANPQAALTATVAETARRAEGAGGQGVRLHHDQPRLGAHPA